MATAEATTVAPTVAPTSIICVACLGAALLAADGRARLAVDGVNAVAHDAAAAAIVTSFRVMAMVPWILDSGSSFFNVLPKHRNRHL